MSSPFANISNFNNISDYLPLLNGALLVEIVIIYLTLNGIIIKTKYLTYWYKHYGLSAVIADVLIVMIGLILTRFFYHYFFKSFNIVYFIILALIIQIIHDVSFYLFFTMIPRGSNAMLEVFKNYATEMGASAIVGDSSIIIFSALIGSLMAKSTVNTNIIYLIVLLYTLPYILNA
jgi:hypothetical protein